MRTFGKYYRVFLLGVQNSMEYRADFLLGMISTAFPLIIQIFLWTAIFGNASSTTVYGYTYNKMIIYVTLASIITKLLSAGFEWDMADDIKDGGLSKFIVQPIGYFIYRISCFLGQKVVHSGIMLALFTVVLWFFNKYMGLYLDIWKVILFILAILLSIVLNFLLFYITGLASFWLTDIWGILSGVTLAVNIVSGGILPLEMFGETMLKVFEFLPFKYITYFPVSIINGGIASDRILRGICLQIIWITFLSLAAQVCWKLGIKRYIAAGG